MAAPVITAADLKARFPEFTGAPDALVTAVIAEAVSSTPYSVWGARYTQAVLYLAAHLLSSNPAARGSKACCDKDGLSRYLRDRQRLARSLGVGFLVAGELWPPGGGAGSIVPGY